MHYTLHQLQIFLKIVATKSITKAAQELFLTQPAVSIQLKKLQDQFEIPLTEVIGRQLYITDFGNEIAIAAENIVNQMYAINYKTLAYKGVLSGKLKIAIVSTGKYIMPYYLSEFIKSNSGIELEMDVTNKTKVIKSLKNNEIDFALVSILPDDIALESLSLMENKLFLVGDKNVVIDSKLTTSDYLKDKSLLLRELGSATRLSMEKYLKDKGIKTGIKIQLTSNEAVKQAIISGLGYSIMPLIGLKNELENGDLKIIPFPGLPITTTWRLIWLKGKAMSPAAAAYLEFLKENKDQIRKHSFSWTETY
jgi:DNA-binding transcriptional LysR family regulator